MVKTPVFRRENLQILAHDIRMTDYTHGQHTVYHHRYHIVWITKYRYRVLQGDLRLRVRSIIAQVAEELDVKIINGVLSADHIHIFAELHPLIGQFIMKLKRRYFPHLLKNKTLSLLL